MPDEKIQQLKNELKLLDVEEVMAVTGLGEKTVREMMTEEDFPLIQIGRKYQVTFDALKEYLQHRRVK